MVAGDPLGISERHLSRRGRNRQRRVEEVAGSVGQIDNQANRLTVVLVCRKTEGGDRKQAREEEPLAHVRGSRKRQGESLLEKGCRSKAGGTHEPRRQGGSCGNGDTRRRVRSREEDR